MPSGYQANVVAGAPIQSTWGNTIRDRTVMVFDTTAQRDAQIATPTAGMVCYIVADKSIYVHDGAAWQRGLAAPATWYATAAGGAAIPTSTLAVPLITIPTLPAGDYLITAAFGWQMNNAAPQILAQIYRGTTATLLGVVQDARQAAYSPSALGVLTLQAVSKADAGGNVTFGISTSANVAGAATTRASTMSVQRINAMN